MRYRGCSAPWPTSVLVPTSVPLFQVGTSLETSAAVDVGARVRHRGPVTRCRSRWRDRSRHNQCARDSPRAPPPPPRYQRAGWVRMTASTEAQDKRLLQCGLATGKQQRWLKKTRPSWKVAFERPAWREREIKADILHR